MKTEAEIREEIKRVNEETERVMRDPVLRRSLDLYIWCRGLHDYEEALWWVLEGGKNHQVRIPENVIEEARKIAQKDEGV